MKKALCVLILACTTCFVACGNQEKDNGSAAGTDFTTVISVNKDGSVESKIVEEFSQEHYDIEELKAMIENSISEYMQSAFGSEIKLKSCKKTDDDVTVEMEYSDYKAYSEFNGEEFFSGTIKAAYEAGYDLNMTLNSVNNENSSAISKQELLNMGDKHIVIWEVPKISGELQEIEPVGIKCFDEILYTGEGVVLENKKTATINLSDDLGIVVFE